MRAFLIALTLCGVAAAQTPEDKLAPTGKGSDEKVAIVATAYLDKEHTVAALGQDPGPGFVVVQVTLTPAPGFKIQLDRDDFLLRSDRDGQKSRPLEPTQIAGSSVMVVKSVGGTQGAPMAQQRRVPIGVPGTYPGGGLPPSIAMPGETPLGGSATADTSDAQATIEEHGEKKANPLLDALKAKIMPEGETEKPRQRPALLPDRRQTAAEGHRTGLPQGPAEGQRAFRREEEVRHNGGCLRLCASTTSTPPPL